jgi:hypothetical protein
MDGKCRYDHSYSVKFIYLDFLYFNLPISYIKMYIIIESTIFWDISPCRLCLPSAVTLVSCSAYSSTLKMEAIYSSETSVDFNGLHGVTSQKIKLIITTAVRTSNSTCIIIVRFYPKWEYVDILVL